MQEHFSLDGPSRRKLIVHTIPTKRSESTAEERAAAGGGKEDGEGEGEGGEERGEGEGAEGVDETDLGEPLLSQVRVQFPLRCESEQNHPSLSAQPTMISDIAGFKTSLPLFPPTTPHIPTSL